MFLDVIMTNFKYNILYSVEIPYLSYNILSVIVIISYKCYLLVIIPYDLIDCKNIIIIDEC